MPHLGVSMPSERLLQIPAKYHLHNYQIMTNLLVGTIALSNHSIAGKDLPQERMAQTPAASVFWPEDSESFLDEA
jgi:hypothetical protein